MSFKTTAPGYQSSTGQNVPTGKVGQIIKEVVLSASPVSLTTQTISSIKFLTLPAGFWDVSGYAAFSGTSTSTSGSAAQITTTPAFFSFNSTLPAPTTCAYTNLNYDQYSLAASPIGIALPLMRVVVPSFNINTLYLTVFGSFTGGTMRASGWIQACRVG